MTTIEPGTHAGARPGGLWRACRRLLVVASTSVALIAGPAPAPADEWALDAYVGPNFANDDAGDGEATVGGRLGYWLSLHEHVDLGLFADSSAAFLEHDEADFKFVPTTALFLARVPLLKSDAFKQGRVHPYAGVGPSVVWSRVEEDAASDTSTRAGLDVRAGLSFMLFDSFGVFSEYRFTYFEPHFEHQLGGENFESDGDASVHHLLFGTAFRF